MPVPSFTAAVPDNGYRWWYLDAISVDEQHAITVIAFIGSVFSPYYARARKKQNTPANEHCAINVALYGSPWRWCMTERGANSLNTNKNQLSVGKSQFLLDGNTLRVKIDEISTPTLTKVQGEITIELPSYDLDAVPLDNEDHKKAQHFWQPIAPRAKINVAFSKPALQWQGEAYVDSNYGAVPLESSFKHWVWSRTHGKDNSTTVLYDVTDIHGVHSQRNLHYSAQGKRTHCAANEQHKLPPTRYWRIGRKTRTAQGIQINKLQTLEDTPFYSRSRFVEHNSGEISHTVHESLDLQRFDKAWVRTLLPFRMPRSQRTVLID